MVETLSTITQAALTREKVLAKLGPELTADLYVNSSWRDHPPTQILPALDQAPSQENAPSPSPVTSLSHPWDTSSHQAWNDLPLLAPFFRNEVLPIGSNNWVISGAHTISGPASLEKSRSSGLSTMVYAIPFTG